MLFLMESGQTDWWTDYMMGTPSRIHQKLVGQLSRIIGNYIESNHVPVRFILLLLQSLLRKMIKTMLNQISVWFVIRASSQTEDVKAHLISLLKLYHLPAVEWTTIKMYIVCRVWCPWILDRWSGEAAYNDLSLWRWCSPMIVPFEQDLAVGIYNDFMINCFQKVPPTFYSYLDCTLLYFLSLFPEARIRMRFGAGLGRHCQFLYPHNTEVHLHRFGFYPWCYRDLSLCRIHRWR